MNRDMQSVCDTTL